MIGTETEKLPPDPSPSPEEAVLTTIRRYLTPSNPSRPTTEATAAKPEADMVFVRLLLQPADRFVRDDNLLNLLQSWLNALSPEAPKNWQSVYPVFNQSLSRITLVLTALTLETVEASRSPHLPIINQMWTNLHALICGDHNWRFLPDRAQFLNTIKTQLASLFNDRRTNISELPQGMIDLHRARALRST